MVTGQELARRSTKATCGALERQLRVRPENLGIMKAKLRKAGFKIVGTSEEKDIIWFVAPGAALL